LEWDYAPGKNWKIIPFTIYMDENSTSVSIQVNLSDTSGNKGTYSAGWKPVIDIISPAIEDLYDGRELKENENEELDFLVSDNIGVKDVEITIEFKPNSIISKEFLEEIDDVWSFNFYIPDYTDSIEYLVTAEDHSGNRITISNLVNVTQVENVSLEDLTAGNPMTGRSFKILFDLEMKYSAKLVDLFYRFDGGERKTVKGKINYEIENVPVEARVLEYGIEVIDRFGFHYSMTNQLDVLDIIPPNITIGYGIPLTGQLFDVVLEVSDNRETVFESLEVYIDDHWEEVEKKGNSFPIEIREDWSWLFLRGKALDDSGNEMEKNLSLMVADGTPPDIENIQTSITNGSDYMEIHFFANISDNRGISRIWIEYRMDEDDVRSIDIARYSGSEYRGTLILERTNDERELLYKVNAEDESGNVAATNESVLMIHPEYEENEKQNIGLILFTAILAIIIVSTILGVISIKKRTEKSDGYKVKNEDILKPSDEKKLLPASQKNNGGLHVGDGLEIVK
jgi:hypothetical protein